MGNVFSNTRKMKYVSNMTGLPINRRNHVNGLKFMKMLKDSSISAAFLDPQYRGVYEKMQYGNESTSRNYRRVEKPQMTNDIITTFISEISRVLVPSGHLFLWLDKFHLCTDYQTWFDDTCLNMVDMIVWNKLRMGLGYRSRHMSEFLVVLQKSPKRIKGVWTIHNIPDVWEEKVTVGNEYHHVKPVNLQARLIEAVTGDGEVVLDPAAGSYSVMQSCIKTRRYFLGCDISG